jgi:hypothetical protein
MTKAVWGRLVTAVFVAVTVAACGGGGSSSTPTTPTSPSNPTTPTDTATITIGSNGSVSPSSVTITRGGRITFVNSHNRAHDMQSDPHPEHTDCPELGAIGFLNPGQSRTSGNFNTARTCGYHDHNEDNNANLKGRIIIQ